MFVYVCVRVSVCVCVCVCAGINVCPYVAAKCGAGEINLYKNVMRKQHATISVTAQSKNRC